MPSTIIHYFTGTGNTAHAVKMIAKALAEADYSVTTVMLSKGVVPQKGKYDYHIFAFPVLSWSAPAMMKEYVRQMPVSSGEKVAVLAINGAIISEGKLVNGFTGQALEEIEAILKRKKYDIFLTSNASFPDNWTQMTNPCDENSIPVIYKAGEMSVSNFINEFLSEKRSLYRCGGFNKAWSFIVAFLFGKIGRKVLGTFYISDEKCTGCSLCAKSCPSETIVMKNGKPRWGADCEDCNKCINICPEKAIQVSMPLMIIQIVLNLIITVIGIKYALKLSVYVMHLSGLSLVIADIILIYLAVWIGLLITLYPLNYLFDFLASISSLQKFFAKSVTKNFRRYKAPGFNS